MSSAFFRPMGRTLGFALTGICAVTLMTGCGGSDDGSSAPPGPTNAAVYDGSGQEALGSYVGRVSAATGLYATDHYAPVGLTQRLRLALSGTNLVLTTYYLSTGTILAANATSKTYEGTNAWTPSDGTLAGITIAEHWTLSFANGGVALTVAATAGAKSGTLTLELNESTYSYDSSVSYLFWGTTTADQADIRYEGCTSVLQVIDANPGTYAVWKPTISGVAQFYFDGFLKDGDTIRAGGFGSGLAMNHTDQFATIAVHLNAFGRPESTSVVVSDNNARDDDGLTDVEPAEYTTKTAGFRPFLDYPVLYQQASSFQTLHVGSITPGGVLQARFGAAGLDVPGFFYEAGLFISFGGSPYQFAGGYVSPTHRHAVLWEGRSNDFYNDDAFADLDGLLTTQERLTMDVEYNAAHFAIGGTVKLEIYDMADVLLSTETMTYTVLP